MLKTDLGYSLVVKLIKQLAIYNSTARKGINLVVLSTWLLRKDSILRSVVSK